MAQAVLDYWFGLSPEAQFGKDADRDRLIAGRFGAARDAVLASEAAGWRDSAETMLAAIILLDQFSRNIHRGQAEAFAADGLAARLTQEAMALGFDRELPAERRVFLYMPLMHAEDAGLQDLSVRTFEALGIPTNAAFARDHQAVYQRFGRFPGRNAALGRTGTPEEEAYLRETGGGW